MSTFSQRFIAVARCRGYDVPCTLRARQSPLIPALRYGPNDSSSDFIGDLFVVEDGDRYPKLPEILCKTV